MLPTFEIPTIAPTHFNQFPTTKVEWVKYVKQECDQKTITDASEWFARCFAADLAYLDWLQKTDPREYLRESARRGSKVLEILRKKF